MQPLRHLNRLIGRMLPRDRGQVPEHLFQSCLGKWSFLSFYAKLNAFSAKELNFLLHLLYQNHCAKNTIKIYLPEKYLSFLKTCLTVCGVNRPFVAVFVSAVALAKRSLSQRAATLGRKQSLFRLILSSCLPAALPARKTLLSLTFKHAGT